MDHELEGEDLPPDRDSATAEQNNRKQKSVKKTNIKSRPKAEIKPKTKVKWYDDTPWEEVPPEEEPSSSRDQPRERSRSRDQPRDRSRSPVPASEEDELVPDTSPAASAAPKTNQDSSDDELISDSEYNRGFK